MYFEALVTRRPVTSGQTSVQVPTLQRENICRLDSGFHKLTYTTKFKRVKIERERPQNHKWATLLEMFKTLNKLEPLRKLLYCEVVEPHKPKENGVTNSTKHEGKKRDIRSGYAFEGKGRRLYITGIMFKQ